MKHAQKEREELVLPNGGKNRLRTNETMIKKWQEKVKVYEAELEFVQKEVEEEEKAKELESDSDSDKEKPSHSQPRQVRTIRITSKLKGVKLKQMSDEVRELNNTDQKDIEILKDMIKGAQKQVHQKEREIHRCKKNIEKMEKTMTTITCPSKKTLNYRSSLPKYSDTKSKMDESYSKITTGSLAAS